MEQTKGAWKNFEIVRAQTRSLELLRPVLGEEDGSGVLVNGCSCLKIITGTQWQDWRKILTVLAGTTRAHLLYLHHLAALSHEKKMLQDCSEREKHVSLAQVKWKAQCSLSCGKGATHPCLSQLLPHNKSIKHASSLMGLAPYTQSTINPITIQTEFFWLVEWGCIADYNQIFLTSIVSSECGGNMYKIEEKMKNTLDTFRGWLSTQFLTSLLHVMNVVVQDTIFFGHPCLSSNLSHKYHQLKHPCNIKNTRWYCVFNSSLCPNMDSVIFFEKFTIEILVISAWDVQADTHYFIYGFHATKILHCQEFCMIQLPIDPLVGCPDLVLVTSGSGIVHKYLDARNNIPLATRATKICRKIIKDIILRFRVVFYDF
ncbi:hypothetical protein VP01_4109g1 [Puccinia sorghi]|uniref:Uncharacterized protein n=1 Tax=Puccinia sorghi TaxID=27349 RepID=A0A0L6UR91_9BASI|nr:hypothetical protein VP01_4109g1 [Puccinia sorghi]